MSSRTLGRLVLNLGKILLQELFLSLERPSLTFLEGFSLHIYLFLELGVFLEEGCIGPFRSSGFEVRSAATAKAKSSHVIAIPYPSRIQHYFGVWRPNLVRPNFLKSSQLEKGATQPGDLAVKQKGKRLIFYILHAVVEGSEELISLLLLYLGGT
jgi:hypothetical protein